MSIPQRLRSSQTHLTLLVSLRAVARLGFVPQDFTELVGELADLFRRKLSAAGVTGGAWRKRVKQSVQGYNIDQLWMWPQSSTRHTFRSALVEVLCRGVVYSGHANVRLTNQRARYSAGIAAGRSAGTFFVLASRPRF